MLRLGITGSSGFLAWHLRAALHGRQDVSVSLADRSTFADPQKLRAFAANADAIAHFAGINRGTEEEIRAGNLLPARQLVEACDAAGVAPHVLFANSIQHERNTAYALGKRAAADCLAEWSLRRGALFTNLVLPHLFGENGKPFYNSAVTTFCHQLAHGEEPRIIIDADLELIHAQRVADDILAMLQGRIAGMQRIEGTVMSVSAMLSRLREIAASYARQIIPSLATNFELDLFNTYRSYLFPHHYPVSPSLRSDERGELFEAVKTLHGGQCFMSSTRPGITRGNHYHRRKLERFLVVRGEALIRIRRLYSDEVAEYRVSGRVPQYIDMPALHTHNISNVGSEDLITLFWSHDIFDPASPDTFAEAV